MSQDKPFKTIDELVSLLIDERKIECENMDELAKFLKITNYYRFTGYARQFQRNPKYGDNVFIEGTNFASIQEIIKLDSQLRKLLFQQLTVIEIGIRAALAHELGRTHGNEAFYLDESSYLDLNDKQENIVKSLVGDLSRTKAASIAHYADKEFKGDDLESKITRYGKVPIWAAVEVISFGHISNYL